jgi:uncharacterized coiled-coil DUF342 family protein
MEEICKECEYNAGRTCNQNPRCYFEPYGNCCQRVLEVYEELQESKKRATYLHRALIRERAAKYTSQDERDSNADTMLRYRDKIRELEKQNKQATKLIKEINKNVENSFVTTEHGLIYIRDLLKKFLEGGH